MDILVVVGFARVWSSRHGINSFFKFLFFFRYKSLCQFDSVALRVTRVEADAAQRLVTVGTPVPEVVSMSGTLVILQR
ncbi:hypothetical protein E2C01_020508 [Portunus trituberculatus]|uniref:Uncharacterized protein n=1 Tax=Portunus trituberculatus TaxID=210409 RepID=A0A5B7E0B0_PORTR|nr:hypothetical protein [Portunus trituberculatus]